MRTRVFRGLSGLLAFAFTWFLLNFDQSGRTPKELFGFTAVTVAFAAFAFGGTGAADRMMASLFGVGKQT